MALRVLLADESSTIKKVMQLALHDYAVEVRAVPVGLDVLPVAKAFKPDIIFADVMLTKRAGYEVCADLKKDPQTSHIPVVLMWSSFMDLDEKRFQESKANQKLEKPFDSEILRTIIKSLVPKTNTNLISDYLNFPKMPSFAEEESSEEFSQVPLTSKPAVAPVSDSWSKEKLNPIPPPPKKEMFNEPSMESLGQAQVSNDEGEFEEITFVGNNSDLFDLDEPKKSSTVPVTNSLTAKSTNAPLDGVRGADLSRRIQESIHGKVQEIVKERTQQDPNSNQIEATVEEHAKEMIERICWQILPEIAERVVREEINKLLKDVEKSI